MKAYRYQNSISMGRILQLKSSIRGKEYKDVLDAK